MSCLILLLSGHKAVPVKPWLKTTPHLLKMWNNTRNKRPGGDAVGLPGACSGHPLAVSYFYISFQLPVPLSKQRPPFLFLKSIHELAKTVFHFIMCILYVIYYIFTIIFKYKIILYINMIFNINKCYIYLYVLWPSYPLISLVVSSFSPTGLPLPNSSLSSFMSFKTIIESVCVRRNLWYLAY